MVEAKANPFNPNAIVKPTLFGGRAGQIYQMMRKLSQVKRGMSANFIVRGERGIGKTAFAKLSMFLAQQQNSEENLNFLTTYYTITRNQSFQLVLQSSLNLLTDQLPKTAIDRLKAHLGSFFRDGKFTIGAFGMQATVDKKTNTDDETLILKDQAVSILTNILKGLEEDKTSKKGKNYDGILIVLDEIHNTKDLRGIAQIFRGISTTLDMNGFGNIAFMIIGYLEGINQFFEGDPSAKRNFDLISLDIMPDIEAEEILTKGFKEAQVVYDKSMLKKRIKDAGGYPHSIQVLGHHLIETDKDQHIDKQDWEVAVDRTAYELQSKDFSNMYDFEGKVRLREEVLNVLSFLSGPISKTKLVNVFKEQEKNIYTKSCLPELKKTGAIKENPETGLIGMQSMLFKSAVRFHLASIANAKNENKKSKQNLDWKKIVSKLNS